ncbi:hypothetical protein QN219_29565 [Sinorhizobium sp. 7-81]|uniref:hypothetical protein n=1 Tax=Sinorhizobium sp. 8-89 TaxID=3049089 RepID=UPI0024C42CCF|nr:hypothetical protein [Sinorhizobium sp. 8-89]MDK1494124.1 hypothetical protein [Sinorhizobium sp. 8-89]
MGLFDWLFGKKSDVRKYYAHWQTSDRGNPMILYGGQRLTVFPSDGGWKYCIAKGENDDDPYFSDPYRSEEHAKNEALAHAAGSPRQHNTLSDDARAITRSRWEAVLVEKASKYDQISDALSLAANVTDLRKLERKVRSEVKISSWHISECYRVGIEQQLLDQAEALAPKFEALAGAIESRIAELKGRSHSKTRKRQANDDR